MDAADKWRNLPSGPSLKHLTAADYGLPREQQRPALQDIARAHIESFNYAVSEGLNCAAQADVSWSVNGIPKGIIKQTLGNIPIMVKSKFCHLHNLSPKALIQHHEEEEEMGGYFIINGIEKLIRMMIMPRRNFPLAMIKPKWKSRGPGYTEYGVSMHCVKDEHTSVNMTLHYLDSGSVMVNFIYQKELFFIPLGFLLKALVGFSDFQIFQELIKGKEDDTFYKNCVSQMLRLVTEDGCLTQKQVLIFLGQRFRVKLNLPDWYSNERVGEFLFNQCICIHLKTKAEKFYLLCFMTRKLFTLSKEGCMEDNPDSLMNQEVLTSGQLYLMFLKEKMETWLHSVKLALDKKAQRSNLTITSENMIKILGLGVDLTRMLEYLLATGNLRSKSGLGMLQASGLCVIADKLNFFRYLSHFRCVHRGAAFMKMRTTTVRKLLPESWGFLCPVHTPDGEPCGLMNHMTAPCEIVTKTFHTVSLLPLLCSLGVTPVDGVPNQPYAECYPVTLDGALVGWIEKDQAPDLVETFRRFKATQEKKIPGWTEVVLIPMTGKPSLYPGLFIFTTPCRMMRPVQNLALGKEEWIGTMEQVFMNIAVSKDEIQPGLTTHQELFPYSMLSVVACFIPFSDHNQSPRNMYQCQMGKQTMGFPLLTFPYRSDDKLYRLQTPQSPLVRPSIYDYYSMDSYPIGTNAVVAVISYSGYDMEDAMILSKSSWERGFAHGSIYKTERIDLAEKVKQGEDNLVFGIGHDKPVQSLDPDGLPYVGARLQYGDPYYSYVNLNTGESFVTYHKNKETCIVDNIKVCSNDTGTGRFKCVCITFRVPRNPTIGDKFASRHGQKGILSRLWPAEDMPFTESGMVPDILFNPHGFPSRMTIGMLIESMAGKSASLHGLCHDATPFTFSEENSAVEYFGKLLKAAGYNYYGTERMYSGVSGVELEADIFIGLVYYQRLRHMVSDKFQVRTTGARDKVTNQPIGGRNVQGGIRFGEMERDALLAHGTSFLLHDRLFNCSDRSVAHVCVDCGSLLSPLLKAPPAWCTTRARQYVCASCDQSNTIETIAVPYVFRCFVAELAAINVKVKLDVQQI
ncbi:PREDICTED: DNA-directed RNA polymerase I subunit RPA2 isoform X2 [Thamnophis sirtalis]|uniref:DNA-directed RNA polymerase subunit beta n=1 Tax=Thamnophis sirtalis TaxID=35019 RepID=A0A6I9X1Y1_9SAUR|nr:PREDICTED: DNA-directed RNA polymerase I subunit RPA2 isoform X2 [Thamnophis sirtalis]